MSSLAQSVESLLENFQLRTKTAQSHFISTEQIQDSRNSSRNLKGCLLRPKVGIATSFYIEKKTRVKNLESLRWLSLCPPWSAVTVKQEANIRRLLGGGATCQYQNPNGFAKTKKFLYLQENTDYYIVLLYFIIYSCLLSLEV